MRKVIKISVKVLSAVILLPMTILLAATLLLNVEWVQNLVVRKAVATISQNLGTTVSMERISIRGFNKVAIQGLYVEDLAGDTLLYAHDLSTGISKTALLRGEIALGGIKLDGGKIYLFQPKEGLMNIQALVELITANQTAGGGSTKLTFSDIDIKNTEFRLQREGDKPDTTDGIDYDNMIIGGINARSRKLTITGKRIEMELHDVAFKDISGFEVSDMSVGMFAIDDGVLDFEDTSIKTPLSELNLPRIVLKGESWKSYKNFENDVRLDVAVERSDLHSQTLSYFIPRLAHTTDIPLNDVELTFTGTVNDFAGRIANLTSNSTDFEGSYSIRNAKNFNDAQFEVDITRLVTDGNGIMTLMSELSMPQLSADIADMLGRAGRLNITGKVKGMLDDLDADVNINSGIGSIALAAGVVNREGDMAFDGNIEIDKFDMGQLTGNGMLGLVTADGKAKGSLRGDSLSVDGTVAIPALEFNDYTYGNIQATGSFADNVADGRIDAYDPNLQFGMAGRADFGKDSLPRYNLALDLRRADLHDLGFNKRDSVALVSGLIAVNGSGNSLDNLNGTANIDHVLYVSPTDSVSTGNIVFTGRNSRTSKYISLESSFLDAEFVSRMSYDSVMNYLGHALYDYLPALDKDGARAAKYHAEDATAVTGDAAMVTGPTSYGTSRITVNFKQADDVAGIFMPGLSVAENTRAELLFNPDTERLSIEAHGNFIEYNDFLVTKLSLTGNNHTKSDSLSLVLASDELMLSGLSFPSSLISAQASDDNARVMAQISNPQSELSLSLDVLAAFGRDSLGRQTLKAHFLPSNITTGRRVWNISDESILYGSGRLEINDFRMASGSQGLLADGVVSDNRADSLTVALNNLPLAPLSNFTNGLGYELDGTANGNVTISAALSRPLISGEVLFDDMNVNGFEVTPLRFYSRWNFDTERAGMSLSDRGSGKDFVRGYYRPSDGTYTGRVDIAGLPFAAIDPLLAGAVTTSGGMVNINAEVSRSASSGRPVITGGVLLGDLETTVEFNRATYSLHEADIKIENSVARLESTTIFDTEGNPAELKASADLSNLSAIRYNANLTPDNIIALNTGIRDNETFYGKVYASGNINLRGDKMGVNVDITASTSDNSSFFLPIGGTSSIASSDFIVFESKRDKALTDEDVIGRKKRAFEQSRKEADRIRTDVRINMALNVLPNTSVTLMLDREQNNVISARGTASLNMAVNPTNSGFSMYGNYEISQGEYTMNLQDVITNKKFEIQPGGTIQWTGDPANAILGISALYKLRAAPDGLLAQDAAVGRVGRVPVECVIGITGRLSQPEFAFAINTPTLDADTGNRLAAALSSQGMLPLQFMSLVGLGSFYITEDASRMDIGAVSTSAGIGLLTSRLSDMISNDRMRFSLGYRAQDTYNSSEVDIGFSTDILSDRLTVDVETNINTGDNAEEIAAADGSNDVMNYNVTVTGLLNKAGNLRATAFTRVIDRYDYKGLQETGVGIYYREDFDRLSDIGRNAKERKARRKHEREIRRAKKAAALPAPEAIQTAPAETTSETATE